MLQTNLNPYGFSFIVYIAILTTMNYTHSNIFIYCQTDKKPHCIHHRRIHTSPYNNVKTFAKNLYATRHKPYFIFTVFISHFTFRTRIHLYPHWHYTLRSLDYRSKTSLFEVKQNILELRILFDQSLYLSIFFDRFEFKILITIIMLSATLFQRYRRRLFDIGSNVT